MAFDDLGRILQSHGLLLIAISDNQLELASHILDTGLTLEKFPFYPDVIAKKGLDEMLKLLLLRGMRLDNIRSWRWYSLLEGAVEEGNTALLQDLAIYNLLIRNKASVTSEPGKCGKTVLQHAAAAGNIRLFKHIVQHRQADVNEPPDAFSGRTALQTAAESNSPNSLEIMRLLFSAGADCNGPPAEAAGITARSKSLQWVFRSHWLDFFARSILEWRHSNCFSLTSLGAFPYANLNSPEAAISSRNLELTKVLLGLGADADAPGTFVEDKLSCKVP
ncbi:predicted protein [Histoplasma capsulatum var. duboisii H88]|uniref:Predicted protein n=1 Tax=Ajellomyces capsulatus (strain H88) TaxID=544711 RepID=F0UM35_AJEC8|nr:predicted protein [Histoplasma capsulatum var. duboisii H88]